MGHQFHKSDLCRLTAVADPFPAQTCARAALRPAGCLAKCAWDGREEIFPTACFGLGAAAP